VRAQAKPASERVKARPVVKIDQTERTHEQTKIPVRLRHSIQDLAS
jgi:hypothetical protein